MECLSKKLLRNICHTRRHYSEILRLCPDISGYTEVRGIEYVPTRKSTGVFSVEKATKDAYSSHLDSVAETVPGRLVFTASDSSSVYGRTSGVSVPAAYTLMIIKA